VSRDQIRIVCVDDHAIVREGITVLLGLQPDMKVVACAATGERGVELVQEFRPDVTLMDLQLPRMTGVDAIRRIRDQQPDARIIVLTVFQGDEDIYRAVEAGAAAYLSKETLGEELVHVIRDVHAGRGHISADTETYLARRGHRPTLSDREVQVVELIARGFRNKEIAGELRISEQTVVVHIRNIMMKLGVHDRTAVLASAAKRGIIHF
jgi:DNA-binding NarL/FixJ family response regulator